MLTLLRFSLSVKRLLSFLPYFCPPLFASHLRLSPFLISFPSQLKRFKFVFGEILSARLPRLICYIWRSRRALRGLQSCLLQESPTCSGKKKKRYLTVCLTGKQRRCTESKKKKKPRLDILVYWNQQICFTHVFLCAQRCLVCAAIRIRSRSRHYII